MLKTIATSGFLTALECTRVLKTTATSGFLTALECTKSVFSPGSAPDPAGGAYSTPPYPIAGLWGTYF